MCVRAACDPHIRLNGLLRRDLQYNQCDDHHPYNDPHVNNSPPHNIPRTPHDPHETCDNRLDQHICD